MEDSEHVAKGHVFMVYDRRALTNAYFDTGNIQFGGKFNLG